MAVDCGLYGGGSDSYPFFALLCGSGFMLTFINLMNTKSLFQHKKNILSERIILYLCSIF